MNYFVETFQSQLILEISYMLYITEKIVYNEGEVPTIFARYIRFSFYTIIGCNKLLTTTSYSFPAYKNFSQVILGKTLKTSAKLRGNFS